MLGLDLKHILFLFEILPFPFELPCDANVAKRMTWMNSVCLRRSVVIITVQDVGDQGLGLDLLLVQLLHLLLHLDGLPGDGLPRAGHAHDPGRPLEEDHLDPVWHVVCLHHPVVVVQDHDGRHHAARHHEHDGIEVGSCIIII